MAVVTGLMITNAGQARIAADLSGGADLALSHVAWGDAAGNPADPNPAQTALVRERYRAPIASVAVVEGAIVLDAILPADTPDALARASHGFTVSECGLFASDGTMIAVARMGDGYKPGPASGQAVVATYRLKLAVANPSAISVVIDPQPQVALGREVRPQWLTVDGLLNAPPANPAQSATYAIGAAPTGAWAGFAGRIAQWVGVWSLATPPEGHRVNDRSRPEGDPLRELALIGGAWMSAAATDAAYGPTRIATTDEARAGLSRGLSICPADLAALTYLRLPGQDYYVDVVNGADANDGSLARPFKTIAGAQAALIARGQSWAQVNLHVAAAAPAYGGVTFGASPIPAWRIIMAAGAVIDATSLAVNSGRGVVAYSGAVVEVVGGKIRAAYEAAAGSGGAVTVDGVAVELSTMAGVGTIAGYAGGFVNVKGVVNVSGSGAYLFAADHATMHLGFVDAVTTMPLALQFAAGATFASAGVVATNAGNMRVAAPVFSATGAPAGKKFLANLNGVINTAGAGVNFLPGSLAGVEDTATGGRYA